MDRKKKRNIQHILFHQMKLDKIEKSHLDSYEQGKERRKAIRYKQKWKKNLVKRKEVHLKEFVRLISAIQFPMNRIPLPFNFLSFLL